MQEKWQEKKGNERYLHIVQKVIFSASNGGISIDCSMDWTNEQEVKNKINEQINKNIAGGFKALDKNSCIAAYIDAAFGHGYSPKELVNFIFMQFYDLLKESALWQCENKEKRYKMEILGQLKLDSPYELAKECFVTYAQGVKYYQKKNEINICNLFTYNDLIELGGNEFIKDCYNEIGNLESKLQRGDSEIKDDDLISGAQKENKGLEKEENRKAKESAEKQEKKLKHFAIGELKTLPFTAIIATAVGLGVFFGFGVAGVLLFSLIGAPIVFGAVFIGPYFGRKSRQAAIETFVSNRLKGKENLDDISEDSLNSKLEQKNKEYKAYKQKQQDKNGQNKVKNEDNGHSNKDKKINPLGTVNENDKKQKVDPFKIISNQKVDPFKIISNQKNESEKNGMNNENIDHHN